MREIDLYKPLAYLNGAIAGITPFIYSISLDPCISQSLVLLPATIIAEDSYYNDMIKSYDTTFKIGTAYNIIDMVTNLALYPHDRIYFFHSIMGIGLNSLRQYVIYNSITIIRDMFEPVKESNIINIEEKIHYEILILGHKESSNADF